MTVIDAEQISAIIPHRPPMLLLDRVSVLEPRRFAVGHTRVTGDELCLFDGEPMPSVPLLVESWAQAALVLLLWDQPNPDVRTGQVAVVVSVERVRLGRTVRPGDEIEHRVSFVRRYGDMAIVRGTSTVDGEPVLEVGRLVAALRPAGSLRPDAA